MSNTIKGNGPAPASSVSAQAASGGESAVATAPAAGTGHAAVAGKEAAADVVLVAGPTDDGQGLRVLRARNERVEVGEVRPVREGQPMMGAELVALKPREAAPWLCDVDVLHPGSSRALSSPGNDRPTAHGPAQVASAAYRDNWSRIFDEAAFEPQDDETPALRSRLN